MSASRPAPPACYASWLDYVIDPCLVPMVGEVVHARAELAELRKELADTKAQLALQAANTVEAMAQRDAAQAERAEALSALQTKDGLLLAARNSSDTWQAEAVKWRRIRTPNHGPCCTCQGCGLDHDDCKCSEEERDDELRQAVQERDSLRAQVAELRGAILGLGELEGPDEWLTDRGDCIIRMQPSKRDDWNAVVARLRAEPAPKEEEKP